MDYLQNILYHLRSRVDDYDRLLNKQKRGLCFDPFSPIRKVNIGIEFHMIQLKLNNKLKEEKIQYCFEAISSAVYPTSCNPLGYIKSIESNRNIGSFKYDFGTILVSVFNRPYIRVRDINHLFLILKDTKHV